MIPLAAIWVGAAAIAIAVYVGLPDSWAATVSRVPEEDVKVSDGWAILVGWTTLFALFYGVISLVVAGILLRKERRTN